MPSKPVLTLPGTFTLIVEAKNVNDLNATWRNTWDIQQSSGTPQPGDPIITALVDFHRGNLRSDAFISKLTLRNWSQGPQPFANRPFLWESFPSPQATGKKLFAPPAGYGNQGTSPVGGEVVLFCKRIAQPGARSTNLFLRGLLDENDVQSETGGRWTMKPPGSNVTSALFAQIVANELLPFLTPGPTMPQLAIVSVGNHFAGPAVAHTMQNVAFVGPSTNKQTRKNKR